jgi:hypothetical protein
LEDDMPYAVDLLLNDFIAATLKLLLFAQALQWECFSDVVKSKVSSWVHGGSKSSGAAGVLLHLDPCLCISSPKSNPCCPIASCPPGSP